MHDLVSCTMPCCLPASSPVRVSALHSESPARGHSGRLPVILDQLLQQLPGAIHALRVLGGGAQGERLLGREQRLIVPLLAVVGLRQRQGGGARHAEVLEGSEQRVRLQREPAGLAALLPQEVGVGGQVEREGLAGLVLDLAGEPEGVHGRPHRLPGQALDRFQVRASGLLGAGLHRGLRQGDVGLGQDLQRRDLQPLQLRASQGGAPQPLGIQSCGDGLLGLGPHRVCSSSGKQRRGLSSGISALLEGPLRLPSRAQRCLAVSGSGLLLRDCKQSPRRLSSYLYQALARSSSGGRRRRHGAAGHKLSRGGGA
mmetsp:Transcript_105823/g.309542  ORF Transcript_105823/g.309542 Transcript_105823/m.309542 type:complete len:313 (+) Transcript_105823:1-939(+)